ncbi:hypothetical protein MKW98_005668 [Papaver atlanticum]|uniref:ENTH domain-containing protein n=1 Tax=Papaver atlanticum TaxID=357466 RepID=A0AAD4SSG5_9MAGN|nr:hypothetical protein MKW98_005668 [Papaver atlanticum]
MGSSSPWKRNNASRFSFQETVVVFVRFCNRWSCHFVYLLLNLARTKLAYQDSTTVGLAKVNSDYKELDIAIVRATNYVERPSKEIHIRAIFVAVSATRPVPVLHTASMLYPGVLQRHA